ncbi:adenylylsulfatase HINT3 isoform X1 [Corylus avellana]|uniref:adenylylsulfatase HINT3 isoform X1 n=1 Tax=Corylus avellana TaxID=13451 RepID=UPI00286BB60E|nr:adenylylsulfatase HINT3 isoform X1 [Corylus avellana]XP_059434956.1 adenylylsulfatase HINT3 isoform X1 [Corylus avellana]
MEARRLAILCSHLRPVGSGQGETPSRFSRVSYSDCASGGGSEGKDQRNDCVFCKIIRGESPALKLYEDDACLCILDTNPLSHGHSLIIPKSHFPSLGATPPSVVAAMCSKVPFISDAIMKATNCDSFNLVVNNGAAAGQVIFHTHIHIIPRKARDCLWPSESLRRHPLKLDQETLKLVDSVQEVLSPSSNAEDSKDQGSSLTKNQCNH